MTMFMKTRD